MPLQLHLHSRLNIWLQWIVQRQLQNETGNIHVLRFGVTYIRDLTVAMSHMGYEALPAAIVKMSVCVCLWKPEME